MTAQEDAFALRGIVSLLQEAPGTIREIAMVSHLSDDTARRLVKILEEVGIVERDADKIDGKRRNTCYKLTLGYLQDRVPFDPESLAKRRG